MAKRKRKSTKRKATTRRRRPAVAVRVNPPRRRSGRRRYRRNPRLRLSPRGVVNTLVRGVGNTLAVTGGKVASRALLSQMSQLMNRTDPVKAEEMRNNVAWQVGSALLVGVIAEMVLPAAMRPFVVAGSLSAPVESFLARQNIPVVSEALSGVGQARFRVVPGAARDLTLGSYARPRASLGSYARPRLSGVPYPIRTGPSSTLGAYAADYDHAAY